MATLEQRMVCEKQQQKQEQQIKKLKNDISQTMATASGSPQRMRHTASQSADSESTTASASASTAAAAVPAQVRIEMQLQLDQEQIQQQLSSASTTTTVTESTIIDIPSTIADAVSDATSDMSAAIITFALTKTMSNLTQNLVTSNAASPRPAPGPTLCRLSSTCSSSSSSSSLSSSYDTDSSVASDMDHHPTMAPPLQPTTKQQQPEKLAAAAAAATPHVKTITPGCKAGRSSSSEKFSRKKSWPIFTLLISIIEVAIFLYDYKSLQTQNPDLPAPIPIPTDSVFIYRPDRRIEIWRFISYMFLHANWFHLGFNVVVQLFYGIPLEVMHGSPRVAIIYLAGVFAGSLGTSVVDSDVYLVGASGGVYALLAAHLANIMLNYGEMRYAVAQLFSVVIFVSCDLGYALYTQYFSGLELARTAPPVSYIAHLTGALAGLTIGLLVLKSFEHRAYENVIWWLALGIYSAFTVFAISFNLINTMTAQLMEEQGEVITQHLLHNLGVQ